MAKTDSTRNVDDENASVHHRIDDRIYHLVTSVEGMDRDVWKLYQDNARSTTQHFFLPIVPEAGLLEGLSAAGDDGEVAGRDGRVFGQEDG
jgi:hypothetical protein